MAAKVKPKPPRKGEKISLQALAKRLREAKPAPTRRKTVSIRRDKKTNLVQVVPDRVSLSMNNGESVKWECDEDFAVNLGKETPFRHGHFNSGDPHSGPIQPNARPGEYKYSVKIRGEIVATGVIIIS